MSIIYHNIGRSQVEFVANLYLNRSTKGIYYNVFYKIY